MTSTVILSDNGASSGSAGLKTTGGNDGVLILQTTTSGGTATTAMVVDNLQNVGIGGSPSYSLDITTAAARLAIRPSTATNNALTLYSNTGGSAYVGLDSSAGGLISAYALNVYHGGAYPIIMSTSGVERGRWNAGAPILCLSGGNTSATGTGIAFPASQSASSDANTLDDYEEGTWTPVLTDGVNTVNCTGYYTKIGGLVWVSISAYNKNISGFVLGNTLRFSGFPFTASTGADSTFVGTLSSNYPVLFEIQNGQTFGYMYAGSTGGADVGGLGKSAFASSSAASLWGQLSYRAS